MSRHTKFVFRYLPDDFDASKLSSSLNILPESDVVYQRFDVKQKVAYVAFRAEKQIALQQAKALAQQLECEVELAFLQRYSRPGSKRVDARINTFESCPMFQAFKQSYELKKEQHLTPVSAVTEVPNTPEEPQPIAPIVEFLANRKMSRRKLSGSSKSLSKQPSAATLAQQQKAKAKSKVKAKKRRNRAKAAAAATGGEAVSSASKPAVESDRPKIQIMKRNPATP